MRRGAAAVHSPFYVCTDEGFTRRSHAAGTGSRAGQKQDREPTAAEPEDDSRAGAGVLFHSARSCAACHLPHLSYRLRCLPRLSALGFTRQPRVYWPAKLQHHSLSRFELLTVYRRYLSLRRAGWPNTSWARVVPGHSDREQISRKNVLPHRVLYPAGHLLCRGWDRLRVDVLDRGRPWHFPPVVRQYWPHLPRLAAHEWVHGHGHGGDYEHVEVGGVLDDSLPRWPAVDQSRLLRGGADRRYP